jgi:hypothetical protein
MFRMFILLKSFFFSSSFSSLPDFSTFGLAFEPVLGQGYIWKVHKTPGSDKWELAMRSHKLWEMLAESIHGQGLNPLEVLGWKKTGIQTLNFFQITKKKKKKWEVSVDCCTQFRLP